MDLAITPEQQVRLVLDIINLWDGPPRTPAFIKRRKRQHRELSLPDFSRPVTTASERDLFLDLFFKHTKLTSRGNPNTDWTALLHDYNKQVITSWEAKPAHVDLYLKEMHHLKSYSQKLALQGATYETARAHAAALGLQGSEAQPTAKRLRLDNQPKQRASAGAMPADGPVERVKGSGVGAKGGEKGCDGCSQVAAHYVPKAGHSCLHVLILEGKLDADHDHAREVKAAAPDPLPSHEECQEHLQVLARKAAINKGKKQRAQARKAAQTG